MRLPLALLGPARSLLKALIFGAVFCVGTFLAVPLLLTLAGYRVNGGSTAVAREAAEARDVGLCSTIINYGLLPLGPTTADARRTCVHAYAEFASDPSACELLMPSWYGLDCVGRAIPPRQCSLFQGHVTWVEEGKTQKVSYSQCGGSEARRSWMENACCTIVLATLVKEANDCSELTSHSSLYDQCHFAVALKNRDPTACLSIRDNASRSGCLVDARALQKNPSICPECSAAVDRLEDLD